MRSMDKPGNRAILVKLSYFLWWPGVNGLVRASVQLEVGVFPAIVDSLSVVVMSVGVLWGCG